MNTLRLKIFLRDVSDWRFQVTDGRGEVISERRLLPDRASAERIGEYERRRIAASLARSARWRRPPPVLRQDEPAAETVRERPRWQKPWKTITADRSLRPLRAR